MRPSRPRTAPPTTNSGPETAVGPSMRYIAGIQGRRPKSKLDGQNARGHWAKRARQVGEWQEMVGTTLRAAGWPRSVADATGRPVVTIRVVQRLGPLPDTDGRVSMCKAIRDAVARWLCVPDDARGPEWRVTWQKGREDAVELELEMPT